MSVLVFIDTADGQIKKSSLEAICYGAKVAEMSGTTAEGVVLGEVKDDLAALGKYGVKKIHHISNALLNHTDSQLYAKVIAQVAQATGAKTIIFSNNVNGKSIAPRVSARLKAGLVSGAISLPEISGPDFIVKKTVFSGKASANVSVKTETKIIALNPNAYKIESGEGTAEVVPFNADITAGKIKVIQTTKASGEIPLTEADIVVSGGRGMKGPENWGILEDLAKVLHAALACSRPVADSHWRPHSEHVGQTGVAIAPNLYIAVGISGAIQHLAGVNHSKIIVVINKDPEAPFFKAADYGIVGDAFEVVPKLTDAIKKLKEVAS
ncbi:MAG: electron transfer flavoprotein subunit alpha/FixB family protein [Chitinophagales bacterium]|nr:electron transfer flavoprotein subunit alpha/FixB family protein [Chitinophagales bacterium]